MFQMPNWVPLSGDACIINVMKSVGQQLLLSAGGNIFEIVATPLHEAFK
jgi:hypothetical protein